MKSLHAARNRVRRGSGGGNSYWLSFSDLMSALLLIFILTHCPYLLQTTKITQILFISGGMSLFILLIKKI